MSIYFYIYDHRDFRRSNHLLKAGLALESDTDARALFSRALKTSKFNHRMEPMQPFWAACSAACQPSWRGRSFLYLQSELLCFKLCLFCHAPTVALWLHPLSNPLTVGYRQALVCSPQSYFFSRLIKSQSLSCFSQGKCSSLRPFQMIGVFPVPEEPLTGSSV